MIYRKPSIVEDCNPSGVAFSMRCLSDGRRINLLVVLIACNRIYS